MMNEFNNRLIYEELSAEILSAIPDDKLEQAVIDYIWNKITDYRNELAIVSDLSPGLQMVYSTRRLEDEVGNGGFNQFFYNSSGQFTEMALKSFQLLGASEYVRILEKAIAIYVQETDSNPLLKELYSKGTIESFFATYELSSLDKCDDEFYALGNQLSDLRIKYVRSNTQEFTSN
jgi:hypothetical protein